MTASMNLLRWSEMPATGDFPCAPGPAPAAGAGKAQPEPDGPLDRLARLARRQFGVDMVLVACSDADGLWQAQAGAPRLARSLIAVVHGHCVFDLDGSFALMNIKAPVELALERVRESLSAAGAVASVS